nr:hypothetical protein 1 [Beihai picorna-like virus 6]
MMLTLLFTFVVAIALSIALFYKNKIHSFVNLFKLLSYVQPQSENMKQFNREKFLRNVHFKKLALKREAGVPHYQKYEPQNLSSSIFMTSLSGHLCKNVSDVMMDKLEGLVSLYFALAEVQSAKQFLAIVTLYAKTHCDKSVIKSVTELSSSLFSDVAPQSSDRPEWLSLMTEGLTNWKLITNNPGFEKVSKVISMMVTLGIFQEKSVNIGGLQIFAASAMKTQVTAVDLIDAVVNTVVFFADGAYQCFLDGSFKPLLFSTSKVMEVEKRYIDMLALWEYARNGNLKRFCDMDESQFDHDLKQLVVDLEAMYKGSPIGAERKILSDRWRQMSNILTEFESSRVRGGLRKAPWTFKVFGESSVGKSSFTDVVLYSVLKANGYSAGDDYVITLNPDDKHMSNMRSYVTGIKIDDYGNTKLDYVDLSPSDWIIQICNNIKRYAVMADLANKGKVSIEPAVCAITTNVEDMLAHQLSNEPVSIARRAHVHVDLKVRPEFCKYDDNGNLTHMLDPLKVFAKYGDSDEIQDIWLVTVRSLEVQQSNTSGVRRVAPSFQFADKEGLTNVSIFDFLKYAIEESKAHFHVQENLVKHSTDLAARLPWCERCNSPSQLCDCEDECEPQFGHRLAHHLKSIGSGFSNKLNRSLFDISTRAEDIAVEKLLSGVRWFESSPWAVWTNYLPDAVIDNDYVKGYLLWCGTDIIKADIKRYTLNFFIIAFTAACVVSVVSFFLACLLVFVSLVWYLWTYATIVEQAKSAYYNRLRDERDVMPSLFKSIREKHLNYVCGAVAGFGLIWAVVKTIQAFRASVNVQGLLNPKSVADIRARDAQANPWTVVEPVNPGIGKTVGQDAQMVNRISKNQWFMSLDLGDRSRFCDALAITTGYFLIPKHMLPDKPVSATLKRAGFYLSFILDPKCVFRLSTGDLAMMYVPNAPDSKDLREYFAEDYEMRQVPAGFVFTREDGSVMQDQVIWHHQTKVFNGAATFRGSYYHLSENTFAGLCMATCYSKSVHKHILGVHLGGVAETPKGCAMALCRTEVSQAVEETRRMSIFHIDTPQSQDLADSMLGKKYALDGDLHRKSPLNYIPEDSAVVSYGNVTGRSTFKSTVIPTPISDVVEEVTGVPNSWGAPKFEMPVVREDGHVDNQTWRPWYESLKYSSNPSVGFAGSDVNRAADDYLSDLREEFLRLESKWKEDIRPLETVEIVSGIDGKRFIDSMKGSTSIGFPIGGPKSNHMYDLDPLDFEAISCPRAFNEEWMDEWHRAMDLWAEGKCVNAIFGSALKDEPTKLSKDKVRVFQGAPFVLQMAIRKYLLPVARFLSFHPLVSECAVGINSAGTEWEELANHMRKHGVERIIAGDYSKYDLRMPAQLTQAAFGIMIEIARWSGNYSARDLKIMNSVAYEVTCPLVAFNGDLMRFLGTNPSGQNMTVYVNSVVNSLLHRLGFFNEYPTQESFGPAGAKLRKQLGRDIRFRDIVSLATYGDDAKGSVLEGFDKFNHISFANFLDANDMKFTMPDKESEPVAFMSDTQADFLKRKNRFDDDLGHTVGMLEEASIFKSLHSILKSKAVTPMEVASQNIDGALREWFFHGREVFEKRREQMVEVQRKAGTFATTLDQSFDDRVAEWKEKYEPQSGEVPVLKTTSFSEVLEPNSDCDYVASSCVGYNNSHQSGRRYEFLYLGRGVFISTRVSFLPVHKLTFCGRTYDFESFITDEPSIDGIANLYYVMDLCRVGSPVRLFGGTWKGSIKCELEGKMRNLRSCRFKGRDDGVGSSDPCVEAWNRGISKFILPALTGDTHAYLNRVIEVQIKGKSYHALLSYHFSQDSGRSGFLGSVRMVSMKTFRVSRWHYA